MIDPAKRAAREREREELKAFIEATPEWEHYKEEVALVVKHEGLHWKKAYYLVRGRRPPLVQYD